MVSSENSYLSCPQSPERWLIIPPLSLVHHGENIRSSGQKILSIVIPTRNRSSFLAELLQCLSDEVILSDLQQEVEIVCVDNFSQDNTREVVSSFACLFPFILYCKQPESFGTAEESMFSAVTFATGDYVWTMGDDDLVLKGGVSAVFEVLRTGEYGFILLNSLITDYQNRVEALYFSDQRENLRYETTKNLFYEMGFVTHTTTISCLCFRRGAFQLETCQDFAAISPIYSHSFSIFTLYQMEPALFLRTPVVCFRLSQAEDEVASHARYQRSLNRSSYWSFHVGFMELVRFSSEQSRIPLEWFLGVQELEFNRFMMAITPMRLRTIVFRAIVMQARLFLMTGDQQEEIIDSDFLLLEEFFVRSDLCLDLQQLRHIFSAARNRQRSGFAQWLALRRLSRIERGYLFKEARYIVKLQLPHFTSTAPISEGHNASSQYQDEKRAGLITEIVRLVRKRGVISCVTKVWSMLNGRDAALLILRLVCHFKRFRQIKLTKI